MLLDEPYEIRHLLPVPGLCLVVYPSGRKTVLPILLFGRRRSTRLVILRVLGKHAPIHGRLEHHCSMHLVCRLLRQFLVFLRMKMAFALGHHARSPSPSGPSLVIKSFTNLPGSGSKADRGGPLGGAGTGKKMDDAQG